uniref:Aprataxin n=1 Tax=Ciona savignyi TaxID=51511 RepID=H2Z7Z8_CIOSA
MSKSVKCYLECCKSSHPKIQLPHNLPVLIGRMPELAVTDKMCSRNQLELTANCQKKYVLVKRLGANKSQINGIDIEQNKSSRLEEGHELHIVNGKYPHQIYFTDENTDTKAQKSTISSSRIQTEKADISSKESVHKRQKVTSKTKAKKAKITLKENDSPSTDSVYTFNSPDAGTLSTQKLESKNTSRIPEKHHWSQGLRASMSDAELIVLEDEKLVVIRDKFPKAKYHWLVLPKEGISSTKNLTFENIDLLQHILKVGKEIANEVTDEDIAFRFGYHAVPSMSQLHMHVISQDFNSPCFKTKKHWNSFTTDYFVNATDIIQELATDGKVQDRKKLTSLLNAPLKCHRCKELQKNIPTLKKHIQKCCIVL